MRGDFDVVVLGSGIAGSIVALVLQRMGLETLVVERKTHPRFVIGESTIPTTSLLLHQLAKAHDVPELAQVAHYLTLRENGCVAWPKQHFWYGLHQEGRPLERRHETMLEGLLLPMGPDVHMLRADADAFLASRLGRYGVEYVEHTDVTDFRSEEGAVRLQLEDAGGRRDVRARFVVDATGHTSFLARKFELRDANARLHTDTRSLFGHFEGVGELDDALGGDNPFRFLRSAGTQHHCFHGGWIWVIPFDNGVTSVGIQLDRRVHPLDERTSPEDELWSIVRRYPSVEAHLGRMRPVRPLIRTDRVQFTSRTILGEGFILTPHAAGFVEPLFSTGILLTAAFASRFAAAAREAKEANDWSAERFRPIERHFFTELAQIDRVVDGVIQSFRHYDLFKQYWRYWVAATFAQWSTAALAGGATREVPLLYGTTIPGFVEEVAAAHARVRDLDAEPTALAAELKARVDPWWERICAPVMGMYGDPSVGATTPFVARGAGQVEPLVERLRRFAAELGSLDPAIQERNAEAWMEDAGKAAARQLERYQRSLAEGGDDHLAMERILSNAIPSRFDYHQAVGLRRP